MIMMMEDFIAVLLHQHHSVLMIIMIARVVNEVNSAVTHIPSKEMGRNSVIVSSVSLVVRIIFPLRLWRADIEFLGMTGSSSLGKSSDYDWKPRPIRSVNTHKLLLRKSFRRMEAKFPAFQSGRSHRSERWRSPFDLICWSWFIYEHAMKLS